MGSSYVAKNPRPGSRPDRREKMTVHVNPGDNAKYLTHALNMFDWKRVDFYDPDKVMERTVAYFQACADDDMKPSVEGLALAYGVDRRRVWELANNVGFKNVPEESKEVVKKAYIVLTAQMANYLQDGKINPVAAIWLMKNNMNYEDKSEVVVSPNNPLGEQKTAAQLEEYIDAIDSD